MRTLIIAVIGATLTIGSDAWSAYYGDPTQPPTEFGIDLGASVADRDVEFSLGPFSASDTQGTSDVTTRLVYQASERVSVTGRVGVLTVESDNADDYSGYTLGPGIWVSFPDAGFPVSVLAEYRIWRFENDVYEASVAQLDIGGFTSHAIGGQSRLYGGALLSFYGGEFEYKDDGTVVDIEAEQPFGLVGGFAGDSGVGTFGFEVHVIFETGFAGWWKLPF